MPKNKSNEFTLTRVYNASLEAAWDAWTDNQQVGKWWGPRGFSITTHSKDLRTGGHWHYTMHGPDGTDYPNKTVYLEVDEKKRLVYDHGANDDQPALFRVTVLFKEVGNKTQLEFTMSCESPEKVKEIQKIIKQANGNSTWDRLGEYLEKECNHKNVFIINRSFDAPIDVLYAAWADPDQLVKWMGPSETSMAYIDREIAVGKTLFYKMSYGTDVTMFGKITYLKIDEPNYLEYTQIFCDKDGNVSRHPMVPTWPETMLTRIQFTSEVDGKTRITLVWEPYGKVQPEEMEAFIKMRDGMTQGWTQSFDKLEEFTTT